ncbi:hypothetical protein WA026_019914 [Henosepilachna vigintioctopunctata]|uniref:Uncharacterized protein n=1 Tax=Henosepilachna vigintioctopunctata TaxID=420089 RepID=A0AAW1V0P1_9CUCU
MINEEKRFKMEFDVCSYSTILLIQYLFFEKSIEINPLFSIFFIMIITYSFIEIQDFVNFLFYIGNASSKSVHIFHSIFTDFKTSAKFNLLSLEKLSYKL